MPAHHSIKDKIDMLWAVVGVNLSPTQKGRNARNRRVIHGQLKNQAMGLGLQTNRKPYVPWKDIVNHKQVTLSQRERTFTDYSQFRNFLNEFNPYDEGNDGVYGWKCYHVEWIMYLKPDSIFDQQCQQLFDVHYGTEGFKMMVIMHKSDRARIKRIEAISRTGKVDILWSDAH
jgi:hypothetical protein